VIFLEAKEGVEPWFWLCLVFIFELHKHRSRSGSLQSSYLYKLWASLVPWRLLSHEFDLIFCFIFNFTCIDQGLDEPKVVYPLELCASSVLKRVLSHRFDFFSIIIFELHLHWSGSKSPQICLYSHALILPCAEEGVEQWIWHCSFLVLNFTCIDLNLSHLKQVFPH
jgi:hypothetical protein